MTQFVRHDNLVHVPRYFQAPSGLDITAQDVLAVIRGTGPLASARGVAVCGQKAKFFYRSINKLTEQAPTCLLCIEAST